ncbi:MAG: OmpA family protein [Kofleriaceae bacterium]
MRVRELGWLLAAWALYGGELAHGEPAGYQIDHYEPTPAGDQFMLVESPWYASTRWFAGDFTLDYAHDLVIARHVGPGGEVISDPAPIANAGTGHLDFAIAFLDRVAVSASVPIVLDQSGTAFAGVGPSGSTAGDPRLGARARLYSGDDGALALDASAYVWIPVGVENQLAGDTSVRGMGRLVVSGNPSDDLRWAANASFLARQTAVLSTTAAPGGNTVGSEVQLSAAASYLALDQRLSIGPEALVSLSLADLPAVQDRATLEVLGAARFTIDDQFVLGVGAGTALAGSGAPDARVLVSFAYAPVRPRGSRFERVIVLPDDEGHVGAVEVDDGHHKTLLDKAYASSEISRKTREVRPVQSSPKELPPVATALVKSLPPRDRDGDGIADASDSCPDRAGVASADPVRNGCPRSAEKIVVLPDEDGHVGGVEVDDGRGKTVLQTAYATAEVSVDGRVESVPASTPKAVDHAVAAIARTLPPPDADGDGIHDLDDACPDRAGVASPDPIRTGCPAGTVERVIVVPDVDGHVGGIEISDGKTTTVLDHAYAAAEIGRDGQVIAVAATTQGRSIERAIAGLSKAMPIVDSDGDGIADARDACPERAGVASTDPLRDGCPHTDEKVVLVPDADGHVGGVEISDGTTTVVLDQAYATSEVSGGKVTAQPPSTALALIKATVAIARDLPVPDRDDDGIADADDACPDRAGPAAPSPLHNGCPHTTEQVVVLPDENGAVGAVEVDDGTSKTLLDKAYAATELGIDGRIRALTTEPSDVSAHYADALAARPPGARIILYFTKGSAPVRDVTGPIDNLAAEVKAKTGSYEIDVIGHTDQTGSERINIKLGQERAQLIANALVAAGIPTEHVHVSSKGSSEPAIKRKSTKVVELSNRRVEIWIR